MVTETIGSIVMAGMGAMPHANGVAFRVWAPNRSEVFVVGSFDEWNETRNNEAKEENGNW